MWKYLVAIVFVALCIGLAIWALKGALAAWSTYR